jgi:hypothetical protein
MMQHMMAKLRELGLKVPQTAKGEVCIPPIVYHNGQQRFPGETVEEAAKQGANFFKAAPQIIFVLLPDNCEPFFPVPRYHATIPRILAGMWPLPLLHVIF